MLTLFLVVLCKVCVSHHLFEDRTELLVAEFLLLGFTLCTTATEERGPGESSWWSLGYFFVRIFIPSVAFACVELSRCIVVSPPRRIR